MSAVAFPAPERSKEEVKEEPRGMISPACQEEAEEEAGPVFLHAATLGVALDNLPANVGE